MTPSVVSDLTLRSLQAAYRGLSARRQAFQDNIANAETPGFLAGRVSFEDSLKRAMNDGDPADMAVSASRSMAAVNANGNNVSVDEELVGLTENGLQNQLVIEAMNAKYRLLRTAISGQ